ncbi:MAG: DNA-directed RNA polymerase subunit omega, partial [Gammaproteobacteria bacterium]|nr:DNA-directed RNA polymerase subunit omega [Gammaproteobacteria bacterium]
FWVVPVAAHRAHQIELGASPKVEKENDKSVVIALREIAEDKIDETILSKPLAEKESWEQEEGLLVQPDDLGQAVADTDNYSDMNETEGDNTGSVKRVTDSAAAKDDSADIS